ncbi:MAG: hypothetical protein KY475_15270 [Planctomycetes bacterium]|nr:hypothetical protein [Planctomycetota bacterium]
MSARHRLLHRFGKTLRLVWAAAFLVVVWLAPIVARAQEAAAEKEEEAKSYVLGYALLTICVGLGIFVVVRPGKRRFPKIRVRTDDEDEKPKGH